MKAACYHGPRDLTVEEVDRPQITPTEIIVKVHACGICGSDLHSYKLELFPEISREVPQGRIPGHEFGGEVVEVGGQVQGIGLGDRVVALTMGAMAEYVSVFFAVPDMTVFKLPPEVSYEEAATVEPLATSLHAAKTGNPAPGETVVVFGAGIIGLGVIQCLKALDVGVKRILAVDVSGKRLDMARRLGADMVINARVDDPVEKAKELAGAIPYLLKPEESYPNVDLAYDCVGYIVDHPGTPVFEQALKIVREGMGRVVVAGAFEQPVTVDLMPLMGKQLKVYGSLGYLPEEVGQAIELIRSRKVDRKCLISHRFSLDKAKEAFETQLKASESVKVLVKP